MTDNVPATRKAAVATIQKLIADRLPAMAAVLPKHLTPERLMRLATFDIARNPALLEASPDSLVGAVLQCAQLGLEPGIAGHAYLVPYRTKGVQRAQLIIGYRGLVELARRSGQVSTIQAQAVYAGDDFAYDLGLEPKLTHRRAESYDGEPRLTHVYAICRLRDGGLQWEVMTRREIDAIRARSKAGDSGPWVTDYAEMAKKSVLRRLAKLLPLSIEYQTALVAEEARETGAPIAGLDDLGTDAEPTAETVAEQPAATLAPEVPPAAATAKRAARKAAATSAPAAPVMQPEPAASVPAPAAPKPSTSRADLTARILKSAAAAGISQADLELHANERLDNIETDSLAELAAILDDPELRASKFGYLKK
jgi:recombination protein RecT